MEGITDTDLQVIRGIATDQTAISDFLSWIELHLLDSCSPSLSATTVQSFAISFLNYIRLCTRPFVAVAFAEPEQVSRCTPSKSVSEQGQDCISHEKVERPNVNKENPHIRPNAAYEEEFPALGRAPSNQLRANDVQKASYEDDFPALGPASAKDSKRTQKQALGQARRVNPTPTANPEVHSSFVLAPVEPSKDSHSKASTALVPGPMKLDIDMLMSRVKKPRSRNQKGKEMLPRDTEEKRVPQVAGKERGEKTTSGLFNMKLSSQTQRTDRPPEQFVPNCTQLPKLPIEELKRLAIVHAKLIMCRLVPSLVGELYFLIQLLCLDDIDTKTQDKGAFTGENFGVLGRLFTHSKSCSIYACKVLEQAAQLLDCVGEQLLAALIEQPSISCHSPSLLSRLRRSLVEYQSVTLRSFKSYEAAYPTKCALGEPSSKGMNIRPPNQLSTGLLASLPFNAARDSRNNFHTIDSQRIYNNRESCRDQFYALIREAASLHASFGFVAIGQENQSYMKLQYSVHRFLKNLMVENYSWFSELFIEQYLQASSYGETDPEVTGLARHDALKLQKLHVRLTSDFNNQTSVGRQKGEIQGPGYCDVYPLYSSGNTLSKACFLQAPRKVFPEALNQNPEHMDGRSFLPNDFLNAFPYSTRIYVLVLEAADSYRLNNQLMFTIKSKIHKLTKLSLYSQETTISGSSFTQRVLYLKSLASLMGFLVFYPGFGSLPSVPSDMSSKLSDSEMHSYQCHLPIDLLEALENAKTHESLLLVLPWILDFLRLKKISKSQEPKAYFDKLFSSLRLLYTLPALDPLNDGFGVNSMCIHAALDSFFEEMGIEEFETGSGMRLSEKGSYDHLNNTEKLKDFSTDNTHNGLINTGIDKMVGIVDSSYIQLCCPLLMGMRSILLVKKEQKLQPIQTYRNTPVRKITPIQSTKQGQTTIMHNAALEPSMTSPVAVTEKDILKLKLQHAFLDQRPQLQRLVDFIVDTVTVNAAHAATLRYVPEVLDEVRSKLEIAILDRFQSLADITSAEDFEAKLNASNFEATMEHIVNTTIGKVLPQAVEYARKHFADRTMEALSALAAPTESSYVLSVAAGIASEAAAIAVYKRTLANVSSEIRKHVTIIVDRWRRKLLKHTLQKPKNCERDRLEDSEYPRWENHGKTTDDVSNMFPEQTVTGKIPLNSAISKNVVEHEHHFVDTMRLRELNVSGEDLKHERLSKCCKQVSTVCSNKPLSDETRNTLRLHLASVCLIIENILSGLEHGVPAGGFDAVVFKPEKEQYSAILVDEDNLDSFRIETGLIRRSVALASYWCLVSPGTAFGLTDEISSECSYNPSQDLSLPEDIATFSTQLIQRGFNGSECKEGNCRCLVNLLQSNNSESLKFYECKSNCSCPLSKLNFCSPRNGKSYPIESLTSTWKSLVKTGICRTEMIIEELLSSWRWEIALCKNPGATSPFWYGATVHGTSDVLVTLIEIAIERGTTLSFLLGLIQKLQNHVCYKANCSVKKLQDCSGEAKKLLECILNELINKLC